MTNGAIPYSFFFKILFFFIFRQRRREGDKEGKEHQCVVAFRSPTTGDLAHKPGMCPDWESNWRPFGSQASTRSTELHQPGHYFFNHSYFGIAYTWLHEIRYIEAHIIAELIYKLDTQATEIQV